jgi:hypothetical protein
MHPATQAIEKSLNEINNLQRIWRKYEVQNRSKLST